MSKFQDIVNSKFPRAKNPEQLIQQLETLPCKGFNTVQRLAMFLAQCAHESAGFSVLSENLNYSAKSLLVVFPKYFNSSNVDAYARNPEKIANRVYANRMGNDAEGDGYKYRGRGYIQLTGKANYQAFANVSSIPDVLDNPDKVATPLGGMESAIWFWNVHNLNKYADNDDIKSCTKIVNGGYNGLTERQELYTSLKKIIQSLSII